MAVTIDPLIRKLELLGTLSDEEKQLLSAIPLDARHVNADHDIVREGEQLSQCILLIEGFSCRYKTLEDGRRQIVAFHIPGDIVDLTSLMLDKLDHSIATLTPAIVAAIPHATLLGLMDGYPRLGRLFLRDSQVDAAIFREWVVNVGRRSAHERIAHLLCELVSRMRAVGLMQDQAFHLPITQSEIADATGLSPVHVNRMLQELRSQGLIEWKDRTLIALNWRGLTSAGGFDPTYLHQLGVAA